MFERSRLHPAYILISFLRTLREMLIPLLFLTITAFRGDSFSWWNLAGFGLIIFFTLVSSLLRWVRFYYYVSNREVRIEYGLFVRKRRFIPYERIQSINLTQGVIHRLFGLVKLQIETAGGSGEPEAQLLAMSREKAEQLRDWIRMQEEAEESVLGEDDHRMEEDKIEYEFKLSKRALIIVASTSGGFGVLFSFIGAFISQIDQFLPDHFFEGVYDALVSSSLLFISILIIFVAIVAWVVSIISTVLRFGGFTLKKQQDELVIERGLLEKRHVTIPLNKVQAVRIEEGILRQPFQLATIQVDIAGDSGQEQEQSTVIHPLIRKKKIHTFLHHVVPTFAHESTFQTVPQRSLRRYITRNTWLTLLIVGLAFWYLPTSYAFATLVFIVLGSILGFLKHEDAGWFITKDLIGMRFRKLKKTTVFTLKKRIQSFEVSETWFQRRKDLASFQISVLGGLLGHTFVVKDMDKKEADELLHLLRVRKDSLP